MEYLTGKSARVPRLPDHLEKRVGRLYTKEEKAAGIPAVIRGTNGKNMYLLQFDRAEPPDQNAWLFYRGEFVVEVDAG